MSRSITAPDGSVSGAGPRDTEMVSRERRRGVLAHAREELGVRVGDPAGRQPQARAIGVLADRLEQFAHERGDALTIYGHGPSLRGRGTRLTGRAALGRLLGRGLLGLDRRRESGFLATARHVDRRARRTRALLARQPLRARREAS